ncbi:MAG: hypothetical protein RIF33_11400 [Cyclobacteriaceae bacterium]
MKTKVEMNKGFDAVEFMRSRRTQISEDIKNMTFEEERAYFEKSAEVLKKYKRIGTKD